MQAVPLDHSRIPKPHTAGTKIHMNHGKEIMNGKGEKMGSITPIKQSEETGGRHTMYDNQPDCTAADDLPSKPGKSAQPL